MKKKFIAPLLLVLLALLFSYQFFIHLKLPIPSDTIDALYHPFRDFYAKDFPHGYPFKNFLITDPLLQQYPWREIAIGTLAHFQLPLWNPYNGVGEPLLANIQSGTFYPLNILLFIFPFAIGWSFIILLQPLLAALFLYWYLRNLNVARNASFLGGVVFAFSGFMTAWLEWGTIGNTALWLPLVLLSIDKIFLLSMRRGTTKQSHIKEKKHNEIVSATLLKIRWLRNDEIIWPIVFILSLSFSFFAGHIQTFFYLVIISFFYFLSRWLQSGRNKKVLISFSICFLAFLILTSVQWLATLQLINLSARSIDQLWQKDGWFIPWQHLIQFIAPDFFGNPSTQNYWGTWNYGEMVGYVGIGSLVPALYAMFFRKDRKTLFFGTFFFLSLIFALPTIFAKLPFLWHIPFIATAQPTRLLFLTDFSLAVLTALGIDYYIRQEKRWFIFYPILFIAIVFILLWLYVLKLHTNTIQISPDQVVIAKHNLVLPTILFIIMSLLLLGYAFGVKMLRNNKIIKKDIFAQVTIGIFILLTIFDLLRFSWKFNTFTDKSLLYPQTKTIKFLSSHSSSYPWRFLGVDYVPDQKRILPPNLSSHYHLYTLDTYNPLLLQRYQEFAAVLEWGFVNIPKFSFNRTIILNNYKSKLVDFLGVKYIVAINPTQSKKLKYLFNEGDTIVYENTQAYPRAFMTYNVLVIPNNKDIAKAMYSSKTDLRKTAIVEEPLPVELTSLANNKNTVSITSYQENSITMNITTNHEGLLVLTDTFYPTWHVKIDGKVAKIYRTDYDFRGVFIPKGNHHVVFYDNLL